jgi:hypothetical protein
MSNIFLRNYSYRMKKNNIFKNYLYYVAFIGFTINIKKNENQIPLYIKKI